MKGFTLVEILVAVSIFLILVLAVFAVMDVGRGAWITGNASVELRQEIIKAFMRMESELKETRPAQIDLPIDSSNPSLTFRVPQDNDGDLTILNSAGNVEWSGNITYALNAFNQITRTASGVTTIIANNILALVFTRPASPDDLLQIDINAQKVSATGKVTRDSGQITIKMRN
jgi:prepilin-type N-terminal cleavage/methylation domain-containing protein